MEEEHEDHGHSVAAWTLVAIVLAGCVVVAIGVVIASLAVGIIGAVVIVIGVITGKVLAMAGYGAKSHAAHGETIASPQQSGRSTLGQN